MSVVHAPAPGTTLHPMCSSRAKDPRVAKPGGTVTCKTCAKAVYGRAQYYAWLREQGVKFQDEGADTSELYNSAPARKPRKSRRKQDPRQTDFADLFNKEDH